MRFLSKSFRLLVILSLVLIACFSASIADRDYNLAIASPSSLIHLDGKFLKRGIDYLGRNDYEGAIADYSKAIEIAQVTGSAESSSTIYSDIYTDRGIAKFMSTDVSAAITDFSQAIYLDRLNARAFFNRGCAHHRQRFLVQTIADFTTSLQLDPHNPDAYMGRAIALHNQGSDREALQDLQIAAREFLTKGEDEASRHALDLWHQLQQKTIFT